MDPLLKNDGQTRLIRSSPRARLARLPAADRQLLLLLVALGPEEARERVSMLADDRREELAPLVAEVAQLPDAERHALFSTPTDHRRPSTHALNARLQRERPRLASLLVRELAPRRTPPNLVPAQPEPAFARTLAAIARRWRDAATAK